MLFDAPSVVRSAADTVLAITEQLTIFDVLESRMPPFVLLLMLQL